jgi:hypothetical protein
MHAFHSRLILHSNTCLTEFKFRQVFVKHMHLFLYGSRGSSVSIVSDYGLDDQGSIPDGGRGFFLQPLRPDRFCPTQPPVQWERGVKRGRGVMLSTHSHLVSRLRNSRSYTSSHPMCPHGVWRDHFIFTLLILV